MEPNVLEEQPQDSNFLELWYLTRRQKIFMNTVTIISLFLLMAPLAIFKEMGFFTFMIMALMVFSFRIWWIWWIEPTDTLFWLGVKIKISTTMLFFT